MTLDMVNKGQMIEIVSIPDDNIRIQAIRLGLYEGAKLICFEKVLAGPVVLQNRLQEIAIGRKLAGSIEIRVA